MVQDALARSGRKNLARDVLRRRERLLMQSHGGDALAWIMRMVRRAWFSLMRANTDLFRVVRATVVLYLAVFPAVYKLTGVLKHGKSPDQAVTVGDSVVFSAAKLVSLSVRDLTVQAPWGAAGQTAKQYRLTSSSAT